MKLLYRVVYGFQFQTFPLSNSRLINLPRFTELQYWLDVIILKTKNFLSFSDEHFSPRFNFMQFDHFLRTFFRIFYVYQAILIIQLF